MIDGVRAIGVVMLVIACGGHDSAPPDATACSELFPPNCCPLPTTGACAMTCGNNMIDNCFIALTEQDSCEMAVETSELCDGSDLPTTCTAFDYFGGQLVCVDCQALDYTNCDACASNASTCVPFSGPAGFSSLGTAIAVFGSDVAVVAYDTSTAATEFLIVDPSTSHVTTAPAPISDIALTSVPDGWLAAGDSRLVHIDGSAHVKAFDVGSDFGSAALSYGPGSNALVAWSQAAGSGEYQLWAALATGEGSNTVAPFAVTGAVTSSSHVVATTDGESFFVASSGTVARIDASGTVLAVDSSFPTGDSVAISWTGTSGVYAARTGNSGTLQAFDDTATPVGMAIPFFSGEPLFGLSDAGDGLVAVQGIQPIAELEGSGYGLGQASYGPTVYRFQSLHVDGNGIASTPVDLGAGYVLPVFARYGENVAAVWVGAGRFQLAIVPPN